MRTTIMKNWIFTVLTATFLLPGLFASERLLAAENSLPVPLPVVVAESDLFEIVGRLDEKGLIFHVDRASTNAPVLDASLTVEGGGEGGGREITAVFRPASGDYLIDDASWLQPLRVPGEYALSFTLLAGEDSDLLSGDLLVQAASTATLVAAAGFSSWAVLLLLAGLGALGWVGWKIVARRQGGAQ
jgi:hypothetical protein